MQDTIWEPWGHTFKWGSQSPSPDLAPATG